MSPEYFLAPGMLEPPEMESQEVEPVPLTMDRLDPLGKLELKKGVERAFLVPRRL